MSLDFIEEPLCDKFMGSTADRPCWYVFVVILEGSVANQLGIDTTISCIVDILEEYAI